MADQLVCSEDRASIEGSVAAQGRAQFVAPVVEDLGRLQALTQLLQVTAEP
jgi:hypothetical protein